MLIGIHPPLPSMIPLEKSLGEQDDGAILIVSPDRGVGSQCAPDWLECRIGSNWIGEGRSQDGFR